MARPSAGHFDVRKGLRVVAPALMVYAVAATSASAQIATDGTMGPAQVLNGLDVTIPANLGKAMGGNLFHSFSDFNIATGGSATFTGPGTFDNVISRVTGGSVSNIDGLLKSEVGSTGFFFINPAGVMFGPNASIDVPGAFHVSTADQVRFPDGGVFDAATPGNTILSVADPSAFGFLNTNPASIAVNGAALNVAAGETLSVIGGDVAINGGILSAPSGVISLASVASAGEVALTPDGPALAGFGALGAIDMTDAALLSTQVPLANIPTQPGDLTGPGGTIYIRGGRLTIDNNAFAETMTAINSGTTGTANGAPVGVDIQVSGDVVLDKAEIVSSSFGAGNSGDVNIVAGRVRMIADETAGNPNGLGANIGSRVFDSGASGDIHIVADSIELAANSVISTQVTTIGTGQAGDIDIDAGQITIDGSTQFSFIDSSTFGAGSAGNINITADRLVVQGGESGFAGLSTQVGVESTGVDNAGNINLTLDSLELHDAGQINASVFRGPGSGGDIQIASGTILIEGIDAGGTPAGIFSNSVSFDGFNFPSGNSGNIGVTTGNLTMRDRGQISTYAESFGNSGSIDIQADEVSIASGAFVGATSFGFGLAGPITIVATSIDLIGPNPAPLSPFDLPFTGIASLSGVIGAGGGTVSVTANQLKILDGAQINAQTTGLGDGGRVIVSADDVTISGFDPTNARPAGIVTDTSVLAGFSGFAIGRAGEIDITATDLTVSDNGIISSQSSSFGDAGSVSIHADSAKFTNRAVVSTASTLPTGVGAAGTVKIEANAIQVLENSEISTSTFGGGAAGTLTLIGDSLNIDNSTITSSTAGTGGGGNIVITAGGPVLINGADAGILTESASTAPDAGTAGNIALSSARLVLTGGAKISTQSARADGGNIDLMPANFFLVQDSQITTSVGTGEGAGGNITIGPVFFAILEGGTIQANAFGGPGGNILIVANNYIATPDSIVEASSQLGINGTVRIDSPDSDVTTGVVVLSGSLLDAAARLAQQCGARGGRTLASFVGVGRGGLPVQPGAPMPSHYLAAGSKSLADDRPGMAPRPVALPSGTVFVPATLQISCSA